MDKIKAIEAFVTVANLKGFRAAANKLNTSAPTITRLINELEKDLGVTLMKRTTRSITLTDIGLRFYDDGRQVLNSLESAEKAAKSTYSKPVGHLRITAPLMFGQLHLPELICGFVKAYPDITADAVFKDDLMSLYEIGIDVAIRIGDLKDSSMIAKKVGEVTWVTTASPDYLKQHGTPQTPQDLHDHNILKLKVNDSEFRWKFNQDADIGLESRLSFNTIAALKKAAQHDFGIIQTFSYQVKDEIEAGILCPILTKYHPEPTPIQLIHAEGRRTSAKIRAFMDFASKALKSRNFNLGCENANPYVLPDKG
jgi:DNA-binding transcriptional LysR family regulator